jgi:SSS family solute:Na+ symporter
VSRFSWPIDGSIVGLYLLVTIVAGVAVRKYVKRVDHFLVAGREMNTHLGIASLAATEMGIVTCMYTAQAGYEYGFAGATPGLIQCLAMLAIGLTGFCIDPLRASGVATIPELFEKRFGKLVRWLSGVVIVLGGLLNMGVFLRIGGEFLLLVTGFELGWLEIIMTALLVIVAVYTIMGGMLSVLVTDFLQFVVMSAGLILVTVSILSRVGWDALVAAVDRSYGAAGFNPIAHPEMGWPYLLYQTFVQVAVTLTWQTQIQRLLAAKDAKTGRRVYTGTAFFFVCRFLLPGLFGVAALATLDPTAFGVLGSEMMEQRSLYAMPLFLGTFLPIGLMGLLVAAMLAADMSTDSSYMLTWASVIYNDILGPFRRHPADDRRGLRWNRIIVAAIGAFLLFYGLWYRIRGNLWDYLTVTGTIYLASLSVLLIACCYWKRANSWGAIGAIVAGALFPIAFLVLQQVPATSALATAIGPYYAGIAAYVLAAIAMVIGSLLRPEEAR